MFPKLPDLVSVSDTLTIPLTEVFNALRIYVATEDIPTHHDYTTINVLLGAAISAAETKLNKDLRIRTWRYVGYSWESLPLRKFPFNELVSVKYYDVDNVQQTMSVDTDYYLQKFSNQSAYLKFNTTPEVYDRPDAVEVIFKSGTDTIPEDVKLAILLIINQFYDDRSNGKQTMPTAADALLRPHRMNNF
jgi:uncharacterized phiE125 gp8 family phage protein